MWLPKEIEFKKGIKQILEKHFYSDIVKDFKYVADSERYNVDKSQFAINKTGFKLIEVYYKNKFVCDVTSKMSKKQAEYYLLLNITRLYKKGEIRFGQTIITP